MLCRRSQQFLVVCAIVLCCCVIASEADISAECDRERSRLARIIIRQHVLPMARKAQEELSQQCPLDFAKDMFDLQESARHKHRGIHWKCGFCDKTFRTEVFLDQHMSNQHQNETHPGADVCLADYCDVMHCNHFAKQNSERFQPSLYNTSPCRPRWQAQLKHQCQDLADACFLGPGNQQPSLMHEYFVQHFCEAHSCNKQQQRERLETITQLGSEHRVWGYRILVGLLALFMLLLYAGIWLYLQYYPYQSASDLRRTKRLNIWSRLIKKEKAY